MESAAERVPRRQLGPPHVPALVRLGVFDRVWAALLKACEDLDGCDWEWQAADTAMAKPGWRGAWWVRTHRPR